MAALFVLFLTPTVPRSPQSPIAPPRPSLPYVSPPQPWEYTNGWAYRTSGTAASPAFAAADWRFSGPGALAGPASNAAAGKPFPTQSFSPTAGGVSPGQGCVRRLVYFIPCFFLLSLRLRYQKCREETPPTDSSMIWAEKDAWGHGCKWFSRVLVPPSLPFGKKETVPWLNFFFKTSLDSEFFL